MNPDEAMQTALQHHRAGRLAEADAIYRKVIAQNANHANALHLSGVVAYQTRRLDAAVDLITRAIRIEPRIADFHSNLGNTLHDQGRFDDAIAAYAKAIQLKPDIAEIHNNLGNALFRKGRISESVAAYSRAVQLRANYAEAHSNLANALRENGRPDEAIAAALNALQLKPEMSEAHNNLGNALFDKGDFDGAIAAYTRTIQLRPTYAEAYANLGNTLRIAGKLDESISVCRQAVQLHPNYPEGHSSLGNALHDKGQLDEAISAYTTAIRLRPDYAKAYSNLGNTLRERGRVDEAIAACQQSRRLKPDNAEAHSNLGFALFDKGKLEASVVEFREAIRLKPDLAEAHNNLGNTFRSQGKVDESIDACREAIRLKPNFPEAHNNLAMALLVKGEFQKGWPEYEWRWQTRNFPSARRDFPQPQWAGDDLRGRTILLHVEQGMGDAIQFVRYAPLVASRGGRVILECPQSLARLFQTVAGVDQLVIAKKEPLPNFDVHCPLLSLPLAFGTTLETIPAQTPYLSAQTQQWAEKLSGVSKLKVGIVWAGNAIHKNDRNRSLQLQWLSPLARVDGVRFFTLQKGFPAAQAANPPDAMQLIDHTQSLNDFADTAALVANLDLIIAADTAVAHLAGALGKPIWVLVPYAPDFRWMLDRSDSPWYPTMRLFRQPALGDWTTVIQNLVESLLKIA